MVYHIAIDVLNPTSSVDEGTRRAISEKCTLVCSNEQLGLSIYGCTPGVVYIQKAGGSLLIDIIGGEETFFENILKALPKHSVMIRLLERGTPEA
ncbi:MAG: hypothetical protein QXK88_04780 [Desulfurococcaceae archaeon]